MSFDWTHYLKVALFLREQDGSMPEYEAYQRSAISRAYYAAHCTCRNYILNHKLGSIANDGSAHRTVIQIFQSEKDFNKKQIGILLQMLLETRGNADYRNTFPGDIKEQLKLVIKNTNEIFKLLNSELKC